MKSCLKALAGPLALVSVLAGGGSATALGESCAGDRLCPGFVVSADTLDANLEKTFEGYRLADLIPPQRQREIRETGLTLTLARPRPYPRHDRFEAATARHAGDVVFHPESNDVTGWKAGVPFPEIDPETDPHAAAKVIWNVVRGRDRGDTLDQPVFAFILIDGASGIERVQHWGYRRFAMKGLVASPRGPVLGDGTIFDKELLFSIAPQDIKGLGTFTVHYDNGQYNDVWAYVREVRWTRRLTGASWMDAVGGTDWLTDDLLTFGAYPAWYESYNYLGRTTILGIAHAAVPVWDTSASTRRAEFPTLDVTSPPYWNFRETWEPRAVHVVEAIPPEEHPYLKKIMYVDAKTWNSYGNFIFAKNGEHFKTQTFAFRPWPLADKPDQFGNIDVAATMIDFERNHATAFVVTSDLTLNAPLKEEDISLPALEAMGR